MAVLESRELVTVKAAFLASRERLSLAQATFERERSLWADQISAERDYLEAKNALAESQIALRTAKQELEALGFSRDFIENLREQTGESLTRLRSDGPARRHGYHQTHRARRVYVEANRRHLSRSPT
jgi:membrane fusion protein, heavy metal efflux system